VKCSWRRFRLKISKDLKMIKTDNSKNILKVIFCECGQGLGKIAVN
jgi:hypothetical protein